MPYEAPRSHKVLTSKAEIKHFFGGISDEVFRRFVRQGMPAIFERGVGWSAHSENLEQWWKARTSICMAQALDQIPDEP